MSNMFHCAGLQCTRLWHCFGNEDNHIGIETIQELLAASHSNVLPINTHNLTAANGKKGLQIGYGNVTYDELRRYLQVSGMVRMLNINLQVTVDAAVKKAQLAFELSGEPVLKLEVLTESRRTSNDSAVVEAYKRLMEWNPKLIIMPLLSASYRHASQLVESGCPLLRVMGSPIGSCRGIDDYAEFQQICGLGVPVVLDGGVGSPEDFRRALEAGAQGVLINSVLFANGSDPATVMRRFVDKCHELRLLDPGVGGYEHGNVLSLAHKC